VRRQARELTSVQVDAAAAAVRFVLHASHANSYNTAVQVRPCDRFRFQAASIRVLDPGWSSCFLLCV